MRLSRADFIVFRQVHLHVLKHFAIFAGETTLTLLSESVAQGLPKDSGF